MTEATPERVLVIRRQGTLWGVTQRAVRDVARAGGVQGGYRLRLARGAGEDDGAAGDLAADELVEVVDALPVWPAGGTLKRYWSEQAAGLAVHAAVPMVVVDPAHPPDFLRADEDMERTDGVDR